MEISFGPAGTAGLGYEEGLKHCKELGLRSMECEFTYGVRMTNEKAKKIGKLAKELGIKLSVHGPYYVNLASKDKEKLKASKKRILQSCERAHHMDASPVVFHAGYYQDRDKEVVYQIIKKNIQDIQKQIKKNNWKVKLAPETTGKQSQFGDLDELLRLRKEIKCEICIDFAHLYARNQGKVDFNKILKKLKNLPHLHCHFSGIIFTQKGERSHKLLEKKFFIPLARAIKKHRPKSITIINESPDIFGDVIKMKQWF